MEWMRRAHCPPESFLTIRITTGLNERSIMTVPRDEFAHEPGSDPRPGGRRPELIGRGTAAGYTGAYREPGTVDIEEVVAVQTARGPE
jgi:hypothetical protein